MHSLAQLRAEDITHWTQLVPYANQFLALVEIPVTKQSVEDANALALARNVLLSKFAVASKSVMKELNPVFFSLDDDHPFNKWSTDTGFLEHLNSEKMHSLLPIPLPLILNPASMSVYLAQLDAQRSELDGLILDFEPLLGHLESLKRWAHNILQALAPGMKAGQVDSMANLQTDANMDLRLFKLREVVNSLKELQDAHAKRYESASRIVTTMLAVPTGGGPHSDISTGTCAVPGPIGNNSPWSTLQNPTATMQSAPQSAPMPPTPTGLFSRT